MTSKMRSHASETTVVKSSDVATVGWVGGVGSAIVGWIAGVGCVQSSVGLLASAVVVVLSSGAIVGCGLLQSSVVALRCGALVGFGARRRHVGSLAARVGICGIGG